ncbi:MAG: SDR family NAD(P)-dependent oxidoreductase [Micropruina sp.]|nr:SDR family NAD(P)-dependent oxidoreductase [Micropruina sp.]
MSEVVVVFGGRSEIGLEIAHRLAAGNTVVLASRGAVPADPVALPGAARVLAFSFDADDTASHRDLVARIEAEAGPIDIAVLAFGVLGDQARAEADESEVVRILHTDFIAQAALLTVLANVMRPRAAGTIVAFSSVAGQRVRRPNYVYGSAKAGLDGFASGLADALHGSGVDLIIARPGFVIGRMTEGMSPAPFSSTPAQVADAVVRRVRHPGPPELWIPWQLRALFAIAAVVPRSLWRRMPR